MSERSGHPGVRLQELLDGRLTGEERASVERHLVECRGCRAELAALRWTRERMAALSTVPAPPGLAARVREALDAEDAAAGRRLPLWLPLAAAALVIALVTVPLWWARRADAVDEVREDLAAVVAGTVGLEARSLTASELEAWFAGRGIPFEVRVFDLGGMAFDLVGGRVGRVGGAPSALFAYRGPQGALVVCQMYPGTLPAAESPGEIHVRDDGVEFVTVRREGAVLVFWEEGEVICVLASEELPEDQVRALAFAKAVRV